MKKGACAKRAKLKSRLTRTPNLTRTLSCVGLAVSPCFRRLLGRMLALEPNLDLPIADPCLVGGLPDCGWAVDHPTVAQVEDRLVPGAFDTVPDKGSFLERAAGVAAHRPDRID